MEPTYMKIAGATVVVTGGARRIGKHISLGLAQRGANVVVNYQSSATEAHEVVEACVNMGTGALAVQADISSKLGVEAVRDAAISKFGGVDCDRNIAVNLKGPYLGCWLFGLHMRERGHGKIVNITDWGVNRPYTNYAPYFVAKGGIVTLTKVFAKELAPTVMVNAIAPGPILMPDDFSTSTVAAVAQATPLRRIGDPEDLLQTTLYLLEGTDFVTGAVIPVDGGRTIS